MFHVYYVEKDGTKHVRPCPDEQSKDAFIQVLKEKGLEGTAFNREGEMTFQVIRGEFKAKDDIEYTFVDSHKFVKDHRMGWKAEVECYDSYGRMYLSVVNVMTVGSATADSLRVLAKRLNRPKLGNVIRAWNVNDKLPKLGA